jgi:hypothetical protein
VLGLVEVSVFAVFEARVVGPDSSADLFLPVELKKGQKFGEIQIFLKETCQPFFVTSQMMVENEKELNSICITYFFICG